MWPCSVSQSKVAGPRRIPSSAAARAKARWRSPGGTPGMVVPPSGAAELGRDVTLVADGAQRCQDLGDAPRRPRVITQTNDTIVAAARLVEEGRPFAMATVGDARRPASARRGDRGIVTADGALVGWVGGACSEPIVIREALRALADGEARLVRICPQDAGAAAEGNVIIAHSTCASEGTVEVLIEPRLPQPLLS